MSRPTEGRAHTAARFHNFTPCMLSPLRPLSGSAGQAGRATAGACRRRLCRIGCRPCAARTTGPALPRDRRQPRALRGAGNVGSGKRHQVGARRSGACSAARSCCTRRAAVLNVTSLEPPISMRSAMAARTNICPPECEARCKDWGVEPASRRVDRVRCDWSAKPWSSAASMIEPPWAIAAAARWNRMSRL